MLRTRSPVYSPLRAFSLDLHVLGTPPAFVLSQDQTLQLNFDRSVSSWADVYYDSKHCGVRNLLCFVDLLSSFQRPSDFVTALPLRTTDFPPPPLQRGARFLPLFAVPCQERSLCPLDGPLNLGGRAV